MNLEESIILALQGKLEETRSHKEDNERVAPRENTEKVFGELVDVPKRDKFNGKNGWGYIDAQASDENESGISKDIKLYKTLKGFAKDARASAQAYTDTAEHWDDKASELVKSKSKNRAELNEAKLLMTGHEAGMCPKCNTPISNYGDIEWFDDSIGQNFICDVCNLKGTEYFNITFDCIELEKPELDEAKNPENAEINDKIKKSFNGSTKHIDDIEKAGLNVFQDEKGKVQAIGKPEGNGITKDDFKKAHPDMDYYNYMTKEKVKPEEVATGAFSPTNIFRNSDNFEKTISGQDKTYLQTDDNGVSKAIPKRYKTGKSNVGYNPKEFPHKNLNGVASYEQISNKELNTFKRDKANLDFVEYEMNKAKATYDSKKADYDVINDRITKVRDRIAKSGKVTESLSVSRAEQLLINAIESVINNSDDEIYKMLNALKITSNDLKELGYDEDGSKDLLDMADSM